MLIALKERGDTNDVENGCSSELASELLKYLEENKIDLAMQESRSLEAANDVISKLRVEVEPFRVITDSASCSWEEKSAAMRLANKIQKNKRNKLWRKRKRKRVAEMLAKVVTFSDCLSLFSSPLLLFKHVHSRTKERKQQK